MKIPRGMIRLWCIRAVALLIVILMVGSLIWSAVSAI